MKPLRDLDLGFSDAENYKRRENKVLLNKVFFRNDTLDQLCSDSTYFLVGEKGTGKTAYAVYLANNDIRDISGSLVYIRETEYQKFLELKKRNHLQLSDYTSIWRTLILLLVLRKIFDDEPASSLVIKRTYFTLIQDAINDYFNNAYSAELLSALRVADDSAMFADTISKHLSAGGADRQLAPFAPSKLRANLGYAEDKLRHAIGSVHTQKRHTLFIDGIDIRPATVAYDDYRECIAGLANAVWSLNSDFFGTIKDPGGQCRVVLLVRPDILESLGLQNTNTKIRDNSALLDWRSTYSAHRQSDIFCAIDRLLSAQQAGKYELGACWDHYFPFDSPTEVAKDGHRTSFISFLRFSLYRPRDIIVMMDILRELKLQSNSESPIGLNDFNSPEFRKRYAVYLLGEIKDHISFYHTKQEYEAFLKFFEYLNGNTRFDYDLFMTAYGQLMQHLRSINMNPPDFFESGNRFLQYLFDLNVISYIEKMEDGNPHIHWCYRERAYANISPQIKTHMEYELHYGLAKALNLGKRIVK